MTVRSQFTDQELETIRSATQEAEQGKGGELVCVIVNRCDTYPAPIWQAATLGAIGGALGAGTWHQFCGVWPLRPFYWMVLPPILGAALGLLAITTLPVLKRWLISPSVLDPRVDRRAAAAFLSEEISNTRDRTGLLLFIALFEREIRILPDRGLEGKVPTEEWQQIAEHLSAGLRSNDRKSNAIVEAIKACGRALAAHGVSRREDNQDELDNKPRLLDD